MRMLRESTEQALTVASKRASNDPVTVSDGYGAPSSTLVFLKDSYFQPDIIAGGRAESASILSQVGMLQNWVFAVKLRYIRTLS